MATNVDTLENDIYAQAISDDEIAQRLSQNAKETTNLLKKVQFDSNYHLYSIQPNDFKIEKDKKSTYAELQTAIAANCATLKREYEIEIRLGTNIDKVVDQALDECVKAKAALAKRSTEAVCKNMKKINEIYNG